MNDATPTRSPPEVICVAEPDGVTLLPNVTSVFALILLIAAVVAVILALALELWIIWLGLAALVVGAALFAWGRRVKARSTERFRAHLADLRERGVDPLVQDLAARWKPGRTAAPDEGVKAALANSPTPNPPRARIACLGKIDVPEVGELFFEPEIITPTRAIGRQLFFIPIAAAVIAFWLMQVLGVIPGRVINIGSFGYVVAMGVSVGMAWVWRTSIRPTYIRMAPGVIQILEYRFRKAKPTIRSYPLDSGTVAILRGKYTDGIPRGLSLTLLRDEQKDTLELWRMQGRKKAVERMWHALLSTAPTPPLSDEELVG